MWVNRVVLQNFGPFSRYETELVRGLIGITGPNGSGKSTLVNGIYACLTNDFDRFPGVKSDCIYDLAEKGNAFVEIDAVHQGTSFTIRRSLRPNKSVLSIAGEPTIENANVINDRLRKELGVDMKLVGTYAFVPQGDMFKFLSLQPAERAESFKYLCRTQAADVISKLAGEMLEREDAGGEIIDNSDELVTQIGKADLRLANLEARRRKYARRLLNAKSLQSAEKIQQKRQRHQQYREDLPEARQELARRKREWIKLRRQLASRELALAEGKATVEQLRSGGASAVASALRAWETYDRRRQRRRQLEAQLAKLDGDLKTSPPVEPESLAKLPALRDELGKVKAELATAREVHKLRRRGATECPTCHQKVSDPKFVEWVESVLDQAPQQIERIEAQIVVCESYQKDHSQWERGQALRRANRESVLDELKELKELAEPEGDREELQRQANLWQAAQDALEGLQNQRNSVAQEVAVVKSQALQSTKRIKQLEAKLAKTVVDDSLYQRVTERLEEHRQAELALAETDGKLREAGAARSVAVHQLDRLRAVMARRQKLQRAMAKLKRVREVFHWSCLPGRVAQRSLQRLDQDIARALELFDNPFTAAADEGLTLQVQLPGHPPRDARWLSGGQKGVLAIAFRYAVNSLFSTDLGTMFLDEPTANLDSENVDYFRSALEALAAEVKGERQLGIITHAEELRSAFHQVIDMGAR